MVLTLSNTIKHKLHECVADTACYAFDSEQLYAAIVSNNNPRWIIPLGSPLAKNTLSQWMPYSILSQFKWHIICLLSPFKLLAKLPNIINIGSLPICKIKNSVAIKNGTAINSVVPIVYVGTEGLQQKAVASLICTKTSGNIAIMKIAIGSAASRSLNNEISALSTLEKHKFHYAPKCLNQNKALGYTVQTVIDGKLSSRELTVQHIELLSELASVSPKQQTTYLAIKKELLEQLELNKSSKDRSLTENDFTLISKTLNKVESDFELPLIFVHGDFSPWNIKVASSCVKNSLNKRSTKNTHLALIDWEDFKFSGLPLWDLCHFCFMQSNLFDEPKWVACLLESPLIVQYLKSLPLDVENKEVFIRLYIIETILSPSANCSDDYREYLMAQLKKITV
ncbi:hypothetical protein CXF85_13780 [Colwellia sp. 75C3]|uniref:phosphotransferase n=1 Tax=Colwellia sp. 75C3 TaxID=888425 RepID=UPI000C32B27A|nr:phosphotransferase [Colwellia sp. 75C3]PKG82547.1 hypothetical protein CXF85_13780 [Colwellia sp. 75C3]